MLKTQSSIISVVLHNSEGMHRNKIGTKGCEAMAEVIKHNTIITLLDVADNGLGHEGIKLVCEALMVNRSLVTLNIGHNYINRQSIPVLKEALVKSALLELNLSDCRLTDKSLEELSVIFYNNTAKLETLDLSYNPKISGEGVLYLF